MRFADDIHQAVLDNGGSCPDGRTYLGPVTHRCPALNMRWATPWNWKKTEHPAVPASLGPIFLPPDFNVLIQSLNDNPLTKEGLESDPAKNLEFLQGEVLKWVGYDHNGRTRYKEMWDGVPNVEEYPREARARVQPLVEKLDSLLNLKTDSAARSFELRFPTEYCPVVWSFVLSPAGTHLEAVLVFRSVEVSRNILNDLYLFCVYFGFVFAQYDKPKFDIPIGAVNIYALDAHVIDFGGKNDD